MNDHLPQLGSRICLNSFIGTVKYVGPVDNTVGIWLGIEWDDATRGKHDGSKDGKHYFICRSKSSGSFVRPTAAVQYGVSFLEALTSKYIEALHGSQSQEKIVLGSSAGAIEVEAVSLDKIRQKFARLDRLREVSLDNMNVIRGDLPGSISRTCPNIRGLDLSQNLLSSWEVVAQIVGELPYLQRLALNRNRLQLPSSTESLSNVFQKILDLQLNDTLLTWTQIQLLMAVMPRLEAIELGYNQLTSLMAESSLSYLPQRSCLQSLNLDSNLCTDWVHICASLKEYPSLQRLILTANKIESIPLPHDQVQLDTLPNLRYLFLSDNLITSWCSIDALSTWLPNLKSLSLTGNPLVKGVDNEKHARPLTIARIPSLTTLEGTSITSRERTDSELFYLSHITQQGLKTEEQRCKEHPQWPVLCQLHGRPNEAPKNPTSQDKLSYHLIDLWLYPYTESMKQKGFELDPSTKTHLQVLPTMTMRVLRMKICKVLKLDFRRTQLKCWLRMWDGTLAGLEEHDNTKELDWLGMENGSQIIYEVQ